MVVGCVLSMCLCSKSACSSGGGSDKASQAHWQALVGPWAESDRAMDRQVGAEAQSRPQGVCSSSRGYIKALEALQ